MDNRRGWRARVLGVRKAGYSGLVPPVVSAVVVFGESLASEVSHTRVRPADGEHHSDEGCHSPVHEARHDAESVEEDLACGGEHHQQDDDGNFVVLDDFHVLKFTSLSSRCQLFRIDLSVK